MRVLGAFVKNRGFAAGLRAFEPQHRLAQRLVDVERRAVKLVSGLELAVHFFGEMMKAAVIIILIADHNNVIRRGMGGMRRMGW